MALWPKSRRDQVVAGVLGGLAERWATSSTGLRIAYVLLTILTGILPGVVIYLLLALIMD